MCTFSKSSIFSSSMLHIILDQIIFPLAISSLTVSASLTHVLFHTHSLTHTQYYITSRAVLCTVPATGFLRRTLDFPISPLQVSTKEASNFTKGGGNLKPYIMLPFEENTLCINYGLQLYVIVRNDKIILTTLNYSSVSCDYSIKYSCNY